MGTFGLVQPGQSKSQNSTPSSDKSKISMIYNSPKTRESLPISSWITPTKDPQMPSPHTDLKDSPLAKIIHQAALELSDDLECALAKSRQQVYTIASDLQSKDKEMISELDSVLEQLAKMELEQERQMQEKREKEERERKESERKAKEKADVDAEKERVKADMEAKKMDNLKKLQEAEKRAKEEEMKKNAQEAVKVDLPSDSVQPKSTSASTSSLVAATENNIPPPQIVSDAAWNEAKECLDRVMRIKTEIKPSLMANPSFQNQIMKEKMKINRTVGQLTRSQKQLVPLVKTLTAVFEAAKVASAEMYELIMYLAAKKIVKQSEMEVSVKQDSAFPLAILSVHLSSKHPPFQDILLGRMMKKCPYIVPMYPRKQPAESLKEYQKRLGYNVKSDPIESEIQYGERMCGIISLYAAIIQTDTIKNSFGIERGWSWLARILNMKPRKLTPLLLYNFLVIAGHSLIKTYGPQAKKLLHATIDGLIPIIPQSSVASTTKLKLFLEETIIQTGRIPEHNGKRMEP